METEHGREELSCLAGALVFLGQEVENSDSERVTGFCSALFSLLLGMHNTQNMWMSMFSCVWAYISHRLNYKLTI